MFPFYFQKILMGMHAFFEMILPIEYSKRIGIELLSKFQGDRESRDSNRGLLLLTLVADAVTIRIWVDFNTVGRKTAMSVKLK
jgi:hypothetical protein